MKSPLAEKPVLFPSDTATLEALYDVNVPCRTACPVATDIPGYIEAVLVGDYETAWQINRRDNVFPGVLGRVCHRPCEAACRHGREGLGEAVGICHLKRAADDFSSFKEEDVPVAGDKTACVIGAGPAGLTVANDLALRGVRVTVLEQYDEAGGMMRYGIPAFRLPRSVVEADVARITALGVQIETGRRLAGVEEIAQLMGAYDAVVLAGGCQWATRPELSGSDLSGVWFGLEYMMARNRGETVSPAPEKVVVVGGGFTAVDCARSALRQGAQKVALVYRRSEDRMRVGPAETRALREEGIALHFGFAPEAVEGESSVQAIRFSGSREATDGSLEATGDALTLDADEVILAIGQSAEALAGADREKLFVAGDFRNGSGTVVEAVADGRKVAEEVGTAVGLSPRGSAVTARVVSEEAFARQPEWNIPEPVAMPLAALPQRDQDTEVEQGFDRAAAEAEARRCYLCHYQFNIDSSRCVYCMKCIDVMPTDCISLVKGLVSREAGRVAFKSAPNWNQADDIVIDHDACIRCGACARVCPTGCIEIHRLARG